MFLLFVLIYEGAVRNESLSILSRNLSLQYYPFHLHKCIFMQCKPLQNENRYGISKKGFSRDSEYFFFKGSCHQVLTFTQREIRLGVSKKYGTFWLPFWHRTVNGKTGSPLTNFIFFFCHFWMLTTYPTMYEFSVKLTQLTFNT